MHEPEVDIISNLMEKATLSQNGVSFKGKGLKLDKEDDWSEVVEAIRKCEKLEFLNLEGNTLGVEASKAIAKALESKPDFKRALWKDIFTGRMKEEIPEALINLGSGLTLAGARLTELDMSDNAFGPIGVKGLAGLLSSPTCYSLKELKLNNNGLGISGGKMLANALLLCYENSIKEGNPFSLKVFIAGRNRLENEGATAIANVFKTLGSLEEVVLPQNGIYPPGIKALSESFVRNKNLKIINLNDNTVRKTGASSIASALQHLQKLQVLNLGDCLLSTGGAKVLAEALENNHCDLVELDMGFNEIKKSGGMAIAKAMKNKSMLQFLSVNGNYFGKEACAYLKNKMTEYGRISSLQSLSDDDSDGGESDDKDEEDDDTVSGSEQENDNEYENNECENYKNFDIDRTGLTSENLTSTPKSDKNKSEIISHPIRNLSFDGTNTSSISKFLNCPVIDNLKGINKKMIAESIEKLQNESSEYYPETLIQLIMEISSLSYGLNEDVKTEVLEVSFDLYRYLFSWANDKGKISAVNNSLIVHLGLIKSEDKNFKITWNTEGCLSALESAISKNIAPKSTEEVLRCCLKRGKKL